MSFIMFTSLERPFLLAAEDHTSGVKGWSQSLLLFYTQITGLTHSDHYPPWTSHTDLGFKELTWLRGENSLFLLTVHTTLGNLNWHIRSLAPSNQIWFDTMANFCEGNKTSEETTLPPLFFLDWHFGGDASLNSPFTWWRRSWKEWPTYWIIFV